MASLLSRRNGRKSIQFTDTQGKRQEIRLGKLPRRHAEKVVTRVEAILADKVLGKPHSLTITQWINGLPISILKRLEAAGLVEGVTQSRTTVGEFLDSFMTRLEKNAKPNTILFYHHTVRNLLDFFGKRGRLASINTDRAEEWREYLAGLEKESGQRRLSKATINRRVRAARTMFALAARRKLLPENPFAEVQAGDQVNRERLQFVGREVISQVLQACPDAQWRLMVSLARYGGVRCPSEIVTLRWSDIDCERRRITIHSPKTERHTGGECRIIPLFLELEKPLKDVQNQAIAGAEFVITRYRSSAANLRTHFQKIINRAGVAPWPKLWQNLRASRETELSDQYPLHVVCRWIGNSPRIAKNHYLQTTDEHFSRAASPMEPVIPSPAEGGTELLRTQGELQELAALLSKLPSNVRDALLVLVKSSRSDN